MSLAAVTEKYNLLHSFGSHGRALSTVSGTAERSDACVRYSMLFRP
jgi:hypothetical protein